MKSFFLIVLIAFGLGYCFSVTAQNNDFTFKVGQAFINSSKEPLDPRQTNSKSSHKGFGFELGYGHYLKSNVFLKVNVGYSFTEYKYNSITDWGMYHREQHTTETINNYSGNLEIGKRLNYKFIDLLIGTSAGIFVIPNYKSHSNSFSENYDPNNTFMKNEATSVMSIPGTTGFNLYLTTAMYFRLIKSFYIGIDIRNGFLFSKQKGNQIYDSYSIQDGRVYEEHNQKDVEEVNFSMQFFKTQLAVRYVFKSKKAEKLEEQIP